MDRRRIVVAGLAIAFSGWLTAGGCTFDVDRFSFEASGTGGGGTGGGGVGGVGGTGGAGGQGAEPVEPLVLASDQDRPIGIVSDGSHVYWTNAGDGSTATGSLMRVPVGGGPVEELANGLINPSEVDVDDTNVYWVAYGTSGPNGGLSTVPKAGGPQVDLVTGYTQVWDLVVVGTSGSARVYYTCNQCDGGVAGRVEWVPVSGGTPTEVADQQGLPASITTAGDYVYWVNRDSQQVMRADTNGAGLEMTADADAADGITAGEAFLFWTASEQDTVYRMPLLGGTVEQLASGNAYSFGIAADEDFVYFLAGPSLMRVPAQSGQAYPYVTGQNLPYQVAIDDTNVYFTDYLAGTVMQAPK